MTFVFGSLKAATMMGNRDKGKQLVEQVPKLIAIAYNKNCMDDEGKIKVSAFQSYYGITAGTFANWFKPQKISFAYIEKICQHLRISKEQLVNSKYDEFLEINGFKRPPERSQVQPVQGRPLDVFGKRDISPDDKRLMKQLAGDYDMLFLARAGSKQIEYIAIEHVLIGHFDEQRGACPIHEERNFETHTSPSGWLRVTNRRAVAILTYEEEYPESIFYAAPIIDSQNQSVVFYGLYSDVTVEREIFSVRFAMMPSIPYLDSKDRLPLEHSIFKACYPFLRDGDLLAEMRTKDEEGQKRLIIPPDRKFFEMVLEVVRKITLEAAV